MTLFADRSPVALQYVRGYFETVGLMFLITMRKYAENEIKAFEITQLTLLGVLITLGFIGSDWYGDRNTMIIFGTTSDPNYFFGFFLLPMAVALKKLRDNKIYTIICAALLALGAYMVFTSDSRGVLLGLAVMIMSYVFIKSQRGQNSALSEFARQSAWRLFCGWLLFRFCPKMFHHVSVYKRLSNPTEPDEGIYGFQCSIR